MVSGIILAGGASSRMKQNKMLLQFKERAILDHTICTMLQICDEITIVTGYYNVDYRSLFNYNNSIKQVHNAKHIKGMFTSVQEGIKHIHHDCFVIPGDYPLVNSKTYRKLLEAKGEIRVPVYNGRRGHPIFISKTLFTEILDASQDSTLKQFRDRHQVSYVDVEDPHILFDIDDMMEYQKLLDFERMD